MRGLSNRACCRFQRKASAASPLPQRPAASSVARREGDACMKKPRQGAGLVNGADEDGLPPDVEAYSGRINTGFGIDGKPRTERHAQ